MITYNNGGKKNEPFREPTSGEYDIKKYIDSLEGKNILQFGSGNSHLMNGTNNYVLSFTNNRIEMETFISLALEDKTKNYECNFADLFNYPLGLIPTVDIFLHPHGFGYVEPHGPHKAQDEERLLDCLLNKNKSQKYPNINNFPN